MVLYGSSARAIAIGLDFKTLIVAVLTAVGRVRTHILDNGAIVDYLLRIEQLIVGHRCAEDGVCDSDVLVRAQVRVVVVGIDGVGQHIVRQDSGQLTDAFYSG